MALHQVSLTYGTVVHNQPRRTACASPGNPIQSRRTVALHPATISHGTATPTTEALDALHPATLLHGAASLPQGPESRKWTTGPRTAIQESLFTADSERTAVPLTGGDPRL